MSIGGRFVGKGYSQTLLWSVITFLESNMTALKNSFQFGSFSSEDINHEIKAVTYRAYKDVLT